MSGIVNFIHSCSDCLFFHTHLCKQQISASSRNVQGLSRKVVVVVLDGDCVFAVVVVVLC